MASLPQLGVAFGLILGTGFLYLLSDRGAPELTPRGEFAGVGRVRPDHGARRRGSRLPA
jgi:hypothetical protein